MAVKAKERKIDQLAAKEILASIEKDAESIIGTYVRRVKEQSQVKQNQNIRIR